ncbi:hypothetical protein V498_10721 [Pseudogymnoascus sp. VKM F-4517 (FW-2822)]|nr:hypothetical protein V498_10721 [Pseudogymnoascus sp. VKM F-4517 (FW-2822)]
MSTRESKRKIPQKTDNTGTSLAHPNTMALAKYPFARIPIDANLHSKSSRYPPSYNEHLRLAERRLHFNIDALCQIVAKSVRQSSDDITLFTKIAEGGSFRVFEASFQDGSKAIARLPYPCTIPRGYGVASEVATMEFLRSQGVPIPRVFYWDSSASNEVGSEYIIMERVPGRELSETWQTMTFKERMAVVQKIVDVERILFGIQLPVSGSLYFKNFLGADEKIVDIPDSAGGVSRAKFCVGPSTDNWREGIEWLYKFGEKRYPREPLYREFYGRKLVDPQVQIKHLVDYLKVAPHLVPSGEELNAPTIRHPDLSPSNIFISEDGNITGIIDWQHTAVLPIFLQAKIPKNFQNYGDDDSENFRRSKLAEGIDVMSESDKKVEMELYRRRQCLERDAKQKDADEQMHQVREAIGVDIEGWVPNDEFKSAKARAKAMKSEMAQAADSENERREFEKLWPFQDHEETD